MTTLYVVCASGWEYNDEIYTQNEEGGVPLLVFKDETKARAEADRKTLAALKHAHLGEYCYDLSDICSEEGIELLTSWGLYADEDEAFEWDLSALTDEQLVQLIPHLEIDFFSVYEVEAAKE